MRFQYLRWGRLKYFLRHAWKMFWNQKLPRGKNNIMGYLVIFQIAICRSTRYSNPFLLISNQTRFDLRVSWTKSHKKWEQVCSSRRTTLEGNSQLQPLNHRKKIFDHAKIIFIAVKTDYSEKVINVRKKSPIMSNILKLSPTLTKVTNIIWSTSLCGMSMTKKLFTCSPLKVTFLGIIRLSIRIAVFHRSSSF